MSLIKNLRASDTELLDDEDKFKEPPFIGVVLRTGHFQMEPESYTEHGKYFIRFGKSLNSYLNQKGIYTSSKNGKIHLTKLIK